MQKLKNSAKLYEQVLVRIENMIISGKYNKGDLLPSEKEIMNMTGVSRITVREAIFRLNEAGIIETKKGKGSIVVLGREDLVRDTVAKDEYVRNFLESTKVRCMLEPEIAKQRAILATDDDIDKLEMALNDTRDVNFHVAIYNIVGNKFINEFFSSLVNLEEDEGINHLVPPEKQSDIRPEFKRQHKNIFEAIRDHKPDYAYFYMKEHEDFVYETYSEYFDLFY